MDNREGLLDQIRRAYVARDSGALDDLMAMFHPEAVFTIAGDKACMEVAGSTCGRQHLQETMAGLMGAFEMKERRILSEIVDGDRVAVHSRLTVRHTPKNIEQQTEVMDLFRLRDGKIIELIEFADTAVAAKMMVA